MPTCIAYHCEKFIDAIRFAALRMISVADVICNTVTAAHEILILLHPGITGG